MCAALEHWFSVGRYAPIDIQDINISIEKKSRAAAMVEVKHLESVSQWKSCRRFESKKKEEKSLSSITRTKKRKIYDN
jgi:Asp-tRNA(Asn)/Glu-tRNA(Gln) amidotransferase B subunit